MWRLEGRVCKGGQLAAAGTREGIPLAWTGVVAVLREEVDGFRRSSGSEDSKALGQNGREDGREEEVGAPSLVLLEHGEDGSHPA